MKAKSLLVLFRLVALIDVLILVAVHAPLVFDSVFDVSLRSYGYPADGVFLFNIGIAFFALSIVISLLLPFVGFSRQIAIRFRPVDIIAISLVVIYELYVFYLLLMMSLHGTS